MLLCGLRRKGYALIHLLGRLTGSPSHCDLLPISFSDLKQPDLWVLSILFRATWSTVAGASSVFGTRPVCVLSWILDDPM